MIRSDENPSTSHVIKRIVCLANSRKPQGRCIAGRELVDDSLGGWVRPVSDRLNEEVSEYERQYENGSDPQVLDIIEMPLLERRPKNYQPASRIHHFGDMTGIARTVFTIGHSNHAPDYFLSLLDQHEITAIVDVRSIPHSRRYPHFSRKEISQTLRACGIAYVFLGKELGGRGDGPQSYDEHGRVQNQYLAGTDSFRDGLRRVIAGQDSMQLALMCAEREPLECHRGLLVSRELVRNGLRVVHIHADGELETHTEAETRLRGLVGLSGLDLFRTEEQVTGEAYALQESRFAYVIWPSTRHGGKVAQ